MDYSQIMRLFDSRQSLGKNRKSLVARHRSARLNHSVQRIATHEFQHHIEFVVLTEKTVKGCDVWMTQFGQRYGFSSKPFKQFRLTGQLRAKCLDCNFAFEHEVDAFEYGSHAAFADSLCYSIVTDNLADHCLPPCAPLKRRFYVYDIQEQSDYKSCSQKSFMPNCVYWVKLGRIAENRFEYMITDIRKIVMKKGMPA